MCNPTLMMEEKKAEAISITTEKTGITDSVPVPVTETESTIQRQQIAAPVMVTDAHRQENQRLQALTESILGQQMAKQPLSFQVPSKYTEPHEDTYKEKKERKKQLKEGKKLTEDADEYTARLVHGLQHEEQLRRNSLPPEPVFASYARRAKDKGFDERQLVLLVKPVHLNKNGNPASLVDEAAKERNLKFLDDYASGDMVRIKPYLDELVDEMIRYRFSPDMMDAEYFTDHVEEMYNMSMKLTAISDLHKQFPNYFENLPQLKKDLLADVEFMASTFATMVSNTLACHSVDIKKVGNGTISKEKKEAYAERRQGYLDTFKEKCSLLNERRQETLQREAERQANEKLLEREDNVLAITAIGEGAYRYGMPSEADMRTILAEQSGLSVQDAQMLFENEQVFKLLNLAKAYHGRLNIIGTPGNEDSDGADMMHLMAYHSKFVEDAANLAQQFASSEDKVLKAVAGTLGFMAMKVSSYYGMIASLEPEFQYTTKIDGQETLHTMMTDGVVNQFEGVHMGTQYQEGLKAKSELNIPRLDTTLREAAKKLDYSQDPQFCAILMMCEAYENFVRSAQVPPCKTEEEKALYPERVKLLSKQILSFKDRIAARTMSYVNSRSKKGTSLERKLCKVLENTFFFDPHTEFYFSALERLGYRLRHNDFSDEEFNKQSTGVMLSDALQSVDMQSFLLNREDYRKTGGAVSEVYIPKNTAAEQSVFRQGHFFRPWEKVGDSQKDLDEAKGGLRVVQTTKEKVVDSHKAGRDMAVYRVDQLLDAHTIASAEQVLFTVSETRTIGTKMENAKGAMASKYDCGFIDQGLVFNSKTVNLSSASSMSKIYWLQAVDAICGSADRHPGNFFLEVNNRGNIQSITGIDNDMSFGHEFIPMTTAEQQVQFSLNRNNPFLMYTPVYEHAFPCVPKEVKEKVMSIRPQDLEDRLRGLIRDDELIMAVNRLKALQEHFTKIKAFDLENPRQVRLCAEVTRDKVRELVYSDQLHTICGNYFSMMYGMAQMKKAKARR